jgi:hypothetical protein
MFFIMECTKNIVYSMFYVCRGGPNDRLRLGLSSTQLVLFILMKKVSAEFLSIMALDLNPKRRTMFILAGYIGPLYISPCLYRSAIKHLLHHSYIIVHLRVFYHAGPRPKSQIPCLYTIKHLHHPYIIVHVMCSRTLENALS